MVLLGDAGGGVPEHGSGGLEALRRRSRRGGAPEGQSPSPPCEEAAKADALSGPDTSGRRDLNPRHSVWQRVHTCDLSGRAARFASQFAPKCALAPQERSQLASLHLSSELLPRLNADSLAAYVAVAESIAASR